jgi:hypothetical protein
MNDLRDVVGVIRRAVAEADWDEQKSVDDLRREARLALWRWDLHAALWAIKNDEAQGKQ